MLTTENLEQFTKQAQSTTDNVVREYGQHLFLSRLYQQPDAERLLFKGGTALRIVMLSPRFSEDLDFAGSGITQAGIEEIFTNTLAQLEKTGVGVELNTAKDTTGGYLGNATLMIYDWQINIHIEVSLRQGKKLAGIQAIIDNDYIPPYTLVHLPEDTIAEGKLAALFNRQKPRDFYDYFFLLSKNNPLPIVREKETLARVLQLLNEEKVDFRSELKKFLPASHAMLLRDFQAVLERKIKQYLWIIRNTWF